MLDFVLTPLPELHLMTQCAGLAGFLCYFASYAALQFGLLDGNSMQYTAINIVAAVLVLISLVSAFNLASALIQTSWIAIGLIGLARQIARRRLRNDTPRAGIEIGTPRR